LISIPTTEEEFSAHPCRLIYDRDITLLVDLSRLRYGSITGVASNAVQMVEGKERVADAGLAQVGKDALSPVEKYIAWVDIVVNDSIWNIQIFEMKTIVSKSALKLAQSVWFNLRDLLAMSVFPSPPQCARQTQLGAPEGLEVADRTLPAL